MNAKYFYKRLINYREESVLTGKYYSGYSNSQVAIHHKNDNFEWYMVWADGNVSRKNIDGAFEERFSTVDDLTGDDFELFNIVQILKSGYLVLEKVDGNPITDMRLVVSRLHGYIDSLRSQENNHPCLCGGSVWHNCKTDYITYQDINGIELHVRTIKNLCIENIERVYYGARPIPFIKSIDRGTAIHISFVDFMYENDYEKAYMRCNKALKRLIEYMDTIGIKCRWVNCKSKYPVYL